MKVVRLLIVALAVVAITAAPAHAVDGYQLADRGQPNTGGGCGDRVVFSGYSTQNPFPDNSHLYGMSCFVHDGDIFYIIDKKKDGHSVGVHWKLKGGSRSGFIRDRLGKGVNSIKNKNFNEAATIKFRIGRCDQTPSNACRGPAQYRNYSITLCVSAGNRFAPYRCRDVNRSGRASASGFACRPASCTATPDPDRPTAHRARTWGPGASSRRPPRVVADRRQALVGMAAHARSA